MLHFIADRDTMAVWRKHLVPTPAGVLTVISSGPDIVLATFHTLPSVVYGHYLHTNPDPVWVESLVATAIARGLQGTHWTLLNPGLTPLQQDALTAAAEIPAGTLASYGDLAHRIGRPRAARAVGAAMARSPTEILIPTHRVVRSDGRPGLGHRGDAADRLRAYEARQAEIASKASATHHAAHPRL